MSIADDIFEIFSARGVAAYFGEPVSMAEHCLQAAHFAQLDKAPAPLVVAALLHDIGHLVVDTPDDINDWVQDARHEQIGGAWLATRFGPEISEPVRLHVPAKRYLCTTQQSYMEKLSPASVLTLKLQGGAMSTAEVQAFERELFYREAVKVRLWDDQGKVAGLSTLGLTSYRAMIEEAYIS
jgi:[1-hydroxy-2-(trimethylamino)ethyl]phosphonate dioxygenase